MAQNQQTIALPSGLWTRLTNTFVTDITFQVLRGGIFIRFTTDTTLPIEENGLVYPELSGELMKAISSLTNLAGAGYLWAKPVSASPTTVYIDHA